MFEEKICVPKEVRRKDVFVVVDELLIAQEYTTARVYEKILHPAPGEYLSAFRRVYKALSEAAPIIYITNYPRRYLAEITSILRRGGVYSGEEICSVHLSFLDDDLKKQKHLLKAIGISPSEIKKQIIELHHHFIYIAFLKRHVRNTKQSFIMTNTRCYFPETSFLRGLNESTNLIVLREQLREEKIKELISRHQVVVL